MQHIRKLSRSFKQRLKPILNIWQSIQNFIEKLPQPLQDTIFVITLIVLLGTSGWIEYNFKPFTNPKNEYLPITLRSIPNLQEKTESVLRPSQSEITSLAFNPSGTALVSESADDTIKLWDMKDDPIQGSNLFSEGKDKRLILSPSFINDRDTAPNSKTDTLVSVDVDKKGKKIRWKQIPSEANTPKSNPRSNNKASEKTIPLQDIGNAIWPFAFSPDGQFLASDSTSSRIIKLWKYNNVKFDNVELDNDEGFKKLEENSQPDAYSSINAIAFTKNSDIVASAHSDGIINLWRVKSNENKFSYIGSLKDSQGGDEKQHYENKDAEISVLTFLHQNNDFPSLEKRYLLATGSYDGIIKLWKFYLKDEKLKDEKPINLEHPKAINSLAFSHDGQILATGSDDGTIKLWNLSKVWKRSEVEEIRTLRSHPDAVTSLVFSPDDKILASGSDDETIKIWRANSQRLSRWRQPPLLRLSTMSF
ncbi:MAG TPA: WD40 repeat domain-containing protein [Waterburya sp.]|jgi:WD40 repeat protein